MNEKYYPETIDDCYVNKNIKTKIKKLIDNNTLQNIIIYGNSNTCKTTFVNVILNTYYKNISNKQDYYFYINPLIDKNIKNISKIISLFCNTSIHNYQSKYKKIVIIDDANYIHHKIQHQISTFLLRYPNVIFIIVSNNIIDIIDKIQSNCLILYLEKLMKNEYINYIKLICNKENIKIDNSTINLLYILSNGDIRFSLNQIYALSITYDKIISEENFIKVYRIPNQITIKKIIDLCLNKDIKNVINICHQLYEEDFSCNDILINIFNVLSEYDIEECKKLHMLKIIGKRIYNNSIFIESILQLERCLIKVCDKV